MKRNSILPFKQLSLLLVGTGIGVLSINAQTCAQTLLAPLAGDQQVQNISTDQQIEKSSGSNALGSTLPPIVSVARSPMALMKETNWIPTPDTHQSVNQNSSRHVLPPIVSVARSPMALTKETNWIPAPDTHQSVDQDSSIRALPPIVSVARKPMELMAETNWLPTRKVAAQTNTAAVKEQQLNTNAFVEQLIKKSFSAEMIAASENVPVTTTEQVSSLLEVAKPNLDLISIDPKVAEPPAFDLETLRPAAPVAVFIDGPDTLRVGHVGDYEIAIANSSSRTTSVSSIRLQIPASAEILVVEREAKINDLDRTLTWSASELDSGKQERIRFRLKFVRASEEDFLITVGQHGLEPQTISHETIVK